MKKFVKTLAATLAAVLVFGMTVSAAPSSSTVSSNPINKTNAEDVQAMSKSGSTKAFAADGSQVTLNIAALSQADQDKIQQYANDNGLGGVKYAFDMTFNGGSAPYKVELKCSSLVVGNTYTVLHFIGGIGSNNIEKIVVKCNENGVLAFTVNSASPFAIVEGTATATSVVAPKTGEVIALSAIIAIVMMAGAALCAKKARLQK